jgi:hypothetical protein
MDIQTANKKLHKVRIRQKGEKLYLRASLPSKNNQSQVYQQYDIKTGLPPTKEGIKIAYARSQKLESDLFLGVFNWSDWGLKSDSETQVKELTVEEAIVRFEQNYWETRPKTLTKESTFKNDYLNLFLRLPQKKILTEQVLRDLLVSFKPNSRSREKAYISLKALGRWANFELKDWSKLKTNYEADTERYIPSDSEITSTREKIKNPSWQWVYGIMAVYGLRNHEVFHLDLSELPVLKVLATTKTKERLVFPLPSDWINQWELNKAKIPQIKLDRANRDIGGVVTKAFKRENIGFVPYAFRDAYAIRGAVLGIDSAIMAKWMGHSLTVHQKDYQKYIDKEAHLKIWENFTRENLGKN